MKNIKTIFISLPLDGRLSGSDIGKIKNYINSLKLKGLEVISGNDGSWETAEAMFSEFKTNPRFIIMRDLNETFLSKEIISFVSKDDKKIKDVKELPEAKMRETTLAVILNKLRLDNGKTKVVLVNMVTINSILLLMEEMDVSEKPFLGLKQVLICNAQNEVEVVDDFKN